MATTPKRATVAWWVVFCGPVVVAVCVGFAGLAEDGVAAIWTFTVGVWALALTVGVAAAPNLHDLHWWLKVFVGSFAAAGVGLVLLFGVSTVGDEVRKDLATTTTSSTTSTTALSGSTSSVP